MTTAIMPAPASAPLAIASPRDWSREEIDLIKTTVARGTSDNELKLFLYVAKERGLNPLARQIHAVKRFNKSSGKEEMSIQTGIDGFRTIAARTGAYAGSDDPIFEGKPGTPDFSATVTVWRLVQGIRCPFSARARWDEYYPGEKQGFMWKSKPHVMLGKCAEALALRKGFPEDLAGLYSDDEMEQAGPAVGAPQPPPKKAPAKSPKKGPAEPEIVDVEPGPPPPPPAGDVISEPQRVLLWTTARSAGLSEEEIRMLVRGIARVDSTKEIRRDVFDGLLAAVASGRVRDALRAFVADETGGEAAQLALAEAITQAREAARS